MGILARANETALAQLVESLGDLPEHDLLRGPESGLVMVRGRAGGSGNAFNLGEMTVTRCTVRTGDGTLGHAYVSGTAGPSMPSAPHLPTRCCSRRRTTHRSWSVSSTP